MPIPNTISDLDIVPANNSPDGSESVFPNLDDYLRTYAAFIKQLDDRMEAMWPVGSIYINASNTANPGAFLPGTWNKITNGVLYAHGAPDAGALGNTGGASTVTLTTAQMPSHSHSGSTNSAGSHTHTRGSMNITGSVNARKGTQSGGDSFFGATGAMSVSDINDSRTAWGAGGVSGKAEKISFNGASSWSGSTSSSGSHSHTVSIGNAGSGNPHENKMPFLTVYMWKRVA